MATLSSHWINPTFIGLSVYEIFTIFANYPNICMVHVLNNIDDFRTSEMPSQDKIAEMNARIQPHSLETSFVQIYFYDDEITICDNDGSTIIKRVPYDAGDPKIIIDQQTRDIRRITCGTVEIAMCPDQDSQSRDLDVIYWYLDKKS